MSLYNTQLTQCIVSIPLTTNAVVDGVQTVLLGRCSKASYPFSVGPTDNKMVLRMVNSVHRVYHFHIGILRGGKRSGLLT